MGWTALALYAVPCLGQTPTASPPPVRAPIGQSIHAGGIGRLVPGEWGAVGVDVVNPGDQPVDALSAMYFQNQPNLQYGRQVWVPARSRIMTSFPVLAPQDLPRQKDHVEIQTLLIDRTGKDEVLIKSSTGQMLGDAILATVFERPITGLIDDAGDELGGDTVMAMRLVRNLTRRVAILTGDFAPATPHSLQALDHLVLMSDRLAKDSAGLSAIREWVHDGGRLWIMLDQVSSETVQARMALPLVV